MKKKSTILQRNKIIHEFMTGKYTVIAHTPGGHIAHINFVSTSYKECYQKARLANKHADLKYRVVPKVQGYKFNYHKSWEALMPVVREIAKLMNRKPYKNLSDLIYKHEAISRHVTSGILRYSHRAVYEFIDLYNMLKNENSHAWKRS